ncbi:unnamed protein product [Musa acuminata subsp. burmannicoides]
MGLMMMNYHWSLMVITQEKLEETFPVNGVPETRQHAFWVSVDKHYYELSKKLELMHPCSYARFTSADFSFQLITQNTIWCSANTFVDHAAYRVPEIQVWCYSN